MRCQSCELPRINGVVCHEIGCPDAWRDDQRECSECGCIFEPEHRHQRQCGDECYCLYHGLPYECDCETCS